MKPVLTPVIRLSKPVVKPAPTPAMRPPTPVMRPTPPESQSRSQPLPAANTLSSPSLSFHETMGTSWKPPTISTETLVLPPVSGPGYRQLELEADQPEE